MMKIEMQELEGQLVLRVEGRLAGAFVPELENCWKQARETQPGRRISIDLKNVTCVDRAGRYEAFQDAGRRIELHPVNGRSSHEGRPGGSLGRCDIRESCESWGCRSAFSRDSRDSRRGPPVARGVGGAPDQVT